MFVVELACEWESSIANLIVLSVKGGLSGVDTDYMILKDYCIKYGLDVIETLLIVKKIVSKVYGKK